MCQILLFQMLYILEIMVVKEYLITSRNHLIIRYSTERGGIYNFKVYSLNTSNYGTTIYTGTNTYLPIMGKIIYLGVFNNKKYYLAHNVYLKV